MAVDPPPIQEKTANDLGVFPNVWLRWLISLQEQVNTIISGGEVNTASNLGGGEGVFASKSSEDLRFKSLTAGSGVTLTPSATEIEIASSGSSAFSYVAKTATYTALAADDVIEATANTFTITLPTAIGITGKQYNVKNSGTGVITLDTTSSQTIDGGLTATINQYSNITVVSNGSDWIII